MKPGVTGYRRNLIIASIMHVAIIGGFVLVEGFLTQDRSQASIPVEMFVPADILGDMPKGEGTGRGAYTPPKLGQPDAAPGPLGEDILTPEERKVAPPKSAPVSKPSPGEVQIPQKKATTANAAAKTAKTNTVAAASKSAGSATKTAAKQAGKGSPTGSPSGESATDIRNRFAKALVAEAGGTAYGDGRKAGGGEGRSSVIGSRDGSPDGMAGGVGKGTPFWWYYQHVRDRMYDAWQQPPESVNWSRNAFSTVVVRVARSGEIVDVRLQTPSGNRAMDESAITAAKTVRRLQPLPDGLGRETAEISINFQLEG